MIFKSVLLLALVSLTSQAPRIDALVAAVRPVLPFPGASDDGELPADNSAQSRWFVVWPANPGDTRIVVKGNPLHPETQKAGAQAMDQINAAVKDKSVSVVCAKILGPWGTAETTVVTFDQRVISNGGVSVGDKCTVAVTDAKIVPVPKP